MGQKPRIFTREATGLLKDISPLGAFTSGVVTVGMSSVYLFWSTYMSSYPNENPFLALGLMVIPMCASAGIWTLLVISFPRSGGDYVFNTRILNPVVGIMTDLMVFLAVPLNFPFYTLTSLLVISDLFDIGGLMTGNSSLPAMGSQLQEPNIQFAIVSVLLLLSVFLLFGKVRRFFRIQTILNITAIVVFLIFALALFATPNATYQGLFSGFFKTDYNGLIQSAQKQGFTSPLWQIPSLAGLGSMFFWTTIQWPSYVAGEMRDARKSIFSAFLLAEIATFALLFIVGAASMLAFGSNFWYAATYLTGIGKNPLPTEMVLLDLGAPVIGNIALIAIVFIIIAAANWFSGTFALLAASRKIFAWSFDRLIPAKFSEVSNRFGTPTYAVILICILTEIYTAFSYYGTAVYAILEGLGNIYTALFLGIAALSAIVFPFRKQLFDRMPPLVQKRLGPIPVISIVGVIAFVSLMSIFLIGQIIPAVQQGLNVGEAAWTLGSFFAGIPLYYIAKAYRRRSGLDLTMVYREIPPE